MTRIISRTARTTTGDLMDKSEIDAIFAPGQSGMGGMSALSDRHRWAGEVIVNGLGSIRELSRAGKRPMNLPQWKLHLVFLRRSLKGIQVAQQWLDDAIAHAEVKLAECEAEDHGSAP